MHTQHYHTQIQICERITAKAHTAKYAPVILTRFHNLVCAPIQRKHVKNKHMTHANKSAGWTGGDRRNGQLKETSSRDLEG